MGGEHGFGSHCQPRNAGEVVILLVEDNEDDVFLMKRAIKEAGIVNRLSLAEDGQTAIDYLSGADEYSDREKFPMPTVVFLDLKMPRKSGYDVLKWIRGNEALKGLVVVMLTSSEEPRDISRAYREGANSYLVKPPTGDDLVGLAKAFKLYWLERNCFEPAAA
jgi:CheY-like chemotaxis protein